MTLVIFFCPRHVHKLKLWCSLNRYGSWEVDMPLRGPGLTLNTQMMMFLPRPSIYPPVQVESVWLKPTSEGTSIQFFCSAGGDHCA